MKGGCTALFLGKKILHPHLELVCRGTFPGLNDAVADMQKGGRRLAIVTPQLGYGRFSEPPNMTLVVEIELVQVGVSKGFFSSLFGD